MHDCLRMCACRQARRQQIGRQVCVYVCKHVRMRMYIYMHLYIYVYIHIYIYKCILIHSHPRGVDYYVSIIITSECQQLCNAPIPQHAAHATGITKRHTHLEALRDTASTWFTTQEVRARATTKLKTTTETKVFISTPQISDFSPRKKAVKGQGSV